MGMRKEVEGDDGLASPQLEKEAARGGSALRGVEGEERCGGVVDCWELEWNRESLSCSRCGGGGFP